AESCRYLESRMGGLLHDWHGRRQYPRHSKSKQTFPGHLLQLLPNEGGYLRSPVAGATQPAPGGDPRVACQSDEPRKNSSFVATIPTSILWSRSRKPWMLSAAR